MLVGDHIFRRPFKFIDGAANDCELGVLFEFFQLKLAASWQGYVIGIHSGYEIVLAYFQTAI